MYRGDIALDKKITVGTDETLSLTDSTGANTGSLTADLTINKTEFKSAELREAGADGIDTTHEIEADLTPGVWEGKQEKIKGILEISTENPMKLLLQWNQLEVEVFGRIAAGIFELNSEKVL